jgi:hypothetical protein
MSTDRICAPGNWVSRAAVQAGFGGHIEGHTKQRLNLVNPVFRQLLNYFAEAACR